MTFTTNIRSAIHARLSTEKARLEKIKAAGLREIAKPRFAGFLALLLLTLAPVIARYPYVSALAGFTLFVIPLSWGCKRLEARRDRRVAQ